jgi:uncharacterized protein (TIGR00255 family)
MSKAVTSMTGFARVDGAAAGYGWVWEAKSVNSKGLDLRFRLPHGFDHIEANAKKCATKVFSRGNISINLSIQRPEKSPILDVNQEVLDRMVNLAAKYRGGREHVNIETVMTLRGVVEVVDEADEDEDVIAARDAALSESVGELLTVLAATRKDEGDRLKTVIKDHLDEIVGLTDGAKNLADMQPDRRAVRLKEQLDQLLDGETPVPEERLAQEIAMIVARGDIREELDRLEAHVGAAREHLDEGGAIGRQLDFLCQEFNREANTLCSKSSDLELTRIGLALKAAIERLREQVQNVE